MAILVEFVFSIANCVIKLKGLRHIRNAFRFGKDQVKPTSLFRIVQRDAIFRMRESSKQSNKLPPLSPNVPFTNPIQQATKAATKEKTASACQDGYISQSAPIYKQIPGLLYKEYYISIT